MKTVKRTASLILAALVLTVTSAEATVTSLRVKAKPTPEANKEKTRAEIRRMANETLQHLYGTQPLTQATVKKAAGYAVFSNTGVKLLLAGSGKGQGVAVNKKSQQEIFMKMLDLPAGFGGGLTKFNVVFVFENEKAFNSFVESGWQFGGQATAAAITGDKGGGAAGAASVSKGVRMYQFTDNGVPLKITERSTRYSRNDDLN